MKISEIRHGIVLESVNFRFWDFSGFFFSPSFEHPRHLKSQMKIHEALKLYSFEDSSVL